MGVALVMDVCVRVDFSVRTGMEVSGQSSEGPSSSSRQGCYVSWEGSARRERDPSAAPSTVLSEVLASCSRRSTDRPREACPRV